MNSIRMSETSKNQGQVGVGDTGPHATFAEVSAELVAQTFPERLAAAYEAIPAAIVVAWGGGEALMPNAAARRLLDDARVGTLAAHYEQLRPSGPSGDETPLPLDELPLAQALRGETVVARKLKVLAGAQGDGARTFLADASPIVGADGVVVGAVCTYRDITDATLDEEMGDELLGTAAHDLRTPLTALKACVQLIERGFQRLEPAARERTMRLLVSQVDKLSAKIDDVLDAARIRRGRVDVSPIDLDVSSELEKILDEAKASPGCPSCDAEIESGLRAHADPARLRQLLRRILLDGGEQGSDRAVKVRARASGESVQIEIETRAAATSSRARTARRFAQTIARKLGLPADGVDDSPGVIRMMLPTAAR